MYKLLTSIITNELSFLASSRARKTNPKQTKCFSCLEKEHICAYCRSEVNLTGICFRCGKSGHKAAACEATLHCIRCAAAGSAANHLLNGKECRRVPPPSSKIGGKGKEAGGSTKAVSQPPKSSATVAAQATTRGEAIDTVH